MNEKFQPRVSVLLAVYNGAEFVRAAVSSILAQSFTDFELVVVDDGSTDGAGDIVRSFADPRIRLHTNERNLGQTAALNVGLQLCKGEFVARMDADDICHPARLAEQVAYLERHRDVGLLGSAVWVIDRDGRLHDFVPQPKHDAAIRFVAMTKNPFHHPTVMFRRQLIEDHALIFDKRFSNQDYKLWVELLQFTKGANLGRPLLKYRVHGNNMSVLYSAEQMSSSIDICQTKQKYVLGHKALTADQLHSVFCCFYGSATEPVSALERAAAEEALLRLTYQALQKSDLADRRQIRFWLAYLAPQLAWRVDRLNWARQQLLRLPATLIWLRRFVNDVWGLKIRGRASGLGLLL